MNPDPVAPLDPRIAALEHRVRRLQLALGLGGALGVVACTTAAVTGPPREVRAESFVVVDRDGREWGRFGGVGVDGRGVQLRLASPGEEVATESGSAEVLLAVLRAYERADEPVAPPETGGGGWAAVLELGSDAGNARYSGVNVFAHVDGASVDAWHAEKRHATLGAHGGGARLQLVETAGTTGEEGGEDEVGALDLRVESGSPAVEGRSRDGGALFHLRR